jgi:hypothetical protein
VPAGSVLLATGADAQPARINSKEALFQFANRISARVAFYQGRC